MLRKLFWRAPAYGSAPGFDPNMVQDKYRVDKAGNVLPIETPKADPNEGYSFLEVREADLPDLHNALQWFTGQSEVPLPAVVGREKGMVRLRIRGDFTPSPSPEHLSQVVADYKVLGTKFASWAEVIKGASKEVQAVEELTLALAETNSAIKDRPDLAWALRTLEIRSQLRR
jgi:hypothetical protein